MIPTVDCSNNIGQNGNAILQAIESVGFVYLKNIGFLDSEVKKVYDLADKFWSFPLEKKQEYKRNKENNSGYVAPGVELLNPENKVEVREAFNIAFDNDLNKVGNIFDLTSKFWDFPDEVKKLYGRQYANHKVIRARGYVNKANTGFIGPNIEMLHDNIKNEREAFNLTSHEILADYRITNLPSDIVPGFGEELVSFFKKCHSVSMEILQSLALALNLQDPEFFSKTHQLIGYGANATTLRLLHYPALPEDIIPGSARCGEHSDYGTITLLFQDEVGGLEVKDRNGEFVAAKPQPGAVLLNTGDLLQRWTNDRLLAVKHRLLVPDNKELWLRERCSIAFFVHPDDHCVVKPLDGSDKYQPITAKQHLLNMFSKTY